MALPTSRNTTYGVGSKIKAADLNDLQDMIIGGKHGNKILIIPAASGINDTDNGAAFVFAISTGNSFTSDASAGSGTALYFPVPLHVGDRIRSVNVFVNDNNGGAITATLASLPYTTGVPVTRGTDTTAGSVNAPEIMPIASVDYTIPTGENIFIKMAAGGNSQIFYGAEVTYDRQ